MTMDWDPTFDDAVRGCLDGPPPGEELAPDADLRSYGLDSLRTVELVTRLEDGYDVLFPDEALVPETFATPATLWAVVSELVGASA